MAIPARPDFDIKYRGPIIDEPTRYAGPVRDVLDIGKKSIPVVDPTGKYAPDYKAPPRPTGVEIMGKIGQALVPRPGDAPRIAGSKVLQSTAPEGGDFLTRAIERGRVASMSPSDRRAFSAQERRQMENERERIRRESAEYIGDAPVRAAKVKADASDRLTKAKYAAEIDQIKQKHSNAMAMATHTHNYTKELTNMEIGSKEYIAHLEAGVKSLIAAKDRASGERKALLEAEVETMKINAMNARDYMEGLISLQEMEAKNARAKLEAKMKVGMSMKEALVTEISVETDDDKRTILEDRLAALENGSFANDKEALTKLFNPSVFGADYYVNKPEQIDSPIFKDASQEGQSEGGKDQAPKSSERPRPSDIEIAKQRRNTLRSQLATETNPAKLERIQQAFDDYEDYLEKANAAIKGAK